MVELIPNPDKFEDVYPSDSEDEELENEEEEEVEDDDTDSEHDSDEIRAFKQELANIDNELKKAKEEKASTTAQLAMLDRYGASFDKCSKETAPNVAECISVYREERRKIFSTHIKFDNTIQELNKQRGKIEKRQAKATRSIQARKEKANKEWSKRLEKQWEARQDKLTAKRRLNDQREEFWARKVFRVTVTLDTNSDLTPASSRRGSTTSLTKTLTEEGVGDACDVSLSLSYITTSAWWSPRYDLSINTVKSSGLLIYRAEFCNTTSETWRDVKVHLSTSQTSFQGLGDPIPVIQPWHIRLNKQFGNSDGTGNIILSGHEQSYNRDKGSHRQAAKTTEPRHLLFGLGNSTNTTNSIFTAQQQFQLQMRQQQMQAQAVPQQLQMAIQQSALNSRQPPVPSGSGLFGNVQSGAVPPPPTFGTANNLAIDVDDARNTHHGIPDLPSLEQPEASCSESGLTATYDIPGTRTIAPSYTKRRLRIASVVFNDISLSHVIVPKLRAAALLKARIGNKSSLTLLRGPAGLTLDGSFLGNTTLPNCSAGDAFSLSLGVDPGLNVIYAKPSVKRSQSGMFTKDNSGVFTRACTIVNTKSNRGVDFTVIDQIPISEDERLRVEILQPIGLRNEGDKASAGTSFNNKGGSGNSWGRATATIQKNGEIAWDCHLEAGRGVKLVLEYETRFPGAESVVQA